MSAQKILFNLSGSIACYKSCHVISKLVQNGFEVKASCTRSALEFIGLSTLEGLTGKPVYCDMFEKKQAIRHVDLSRWYDLAIICPATANIINKLSSGIADDPVSTIFLAQDFSKPYLIAPAMNTNMYRHPATRESLSRLESWGVQILKTDEGHLACGDEGQGRLLSPDLIYENIIKSLEKTK